MFKPTCGHMLPAWINKQPTVLVNNTALY